MLPAVSSAMTIANTITLSAGLRTGRELGPI